MAALLSNTWPGRIGLPGATISSPVENTATRGRRQTGMSARPTAASMPTSRDVSSRPRRSTVSPRAMSDPAVAIYWPGVAARRSSITGGEPSSSSVCSIMTTASAPRGTMPPVAITTAVPGATGCAGAMPGVKISVLSRSMTGCPSLASAVSSARTANPSTLARSNPGTSSGATTSRASTRPRAAASRTSSSPKGSKRRWRRNRASASSWLTTSRNCSWRAARRSVGRSRVMVSIYGRGR